MIDFFSPLDVTRNWCFVTRLPPFRQDICQRSDRLVLRMPVDVDGPTMVYACDRPPIRWRASRCRSRNAWVAHYVIAEHAKRRSVTRFRLEKRRHHGAYQTHFDARGACDIAFAHGRRRYQSIGPPFLSPLLHGIKMFAKAHNSRGYFYDDGVKRKCRCGCWPSHSSFADIVA